MAFKMRFILRDNAKRPPFFREGRRNASYTVLAAFEPDVQLVEEDIDDVDFAREMLDLDSALHDSRYTIVDIKTLWDEFVSPNARDEIDLLVSSGMWKWIEQTRKQEYY